MTWAERWERLDPMLVLERRQEQAARSKPAKAEKAAQALEALFEGEDMGRQLSVPTRVLNAMHQWGAWARRPQFWANLNPTPFYRLLGIGSGREAPDIKLDPQSIAIHKSVMRLRCEKTRIILYAYYVADCVWSDHQQKFIDAGISESTFHRLLKAGSISAINAAKLGKSLDDGITA